MKSTRRNLSNQNSNSKTIKYQFDEVQGSPSKKITILDLCAEEKAKIGELIRKLAEEQEEKQKLTEQQLKYEQNLKQIKKANESIIKEKKQVEDKYQESLNIIRKLQQQEIMLEQQKQFIRQDNETQYEETISKENKENIPTQTSREIGIQVLDSPVVRPISEKSLKIIEEKQVVPEQSEIMKLKQEIEEITSGLKSLYFNKSEGLQSHDQSKSQFAEDNKDTYFENLIKQSPVKFSNCNELMETSFCQDKKEKKFLNEFLTLDKKLKENRQQAVQISSMASGSRLSSESSSSSSDEVEVARKLLSKKKQRLQSKLDCPKPQRNLQQQMDYAKPKRNLESSLGQEVQQKDLSEQDMQKISKFLDKKLQSILSQSQSLSFNISQPQMTPQNKVSESMLQTPEPQRNQPSKYHDEIDELIDSLNSEQYQKRFQKPTTSKKQELVYGHNLIDAIDLIESSQKINRTDESMSSDYNQLIEKYMRLADDLQE